MDQAFLAGIGGVCVAFSQLELSLELVIGALLVGTQLDSQATGRIVTAELSFQKAVHLFEALHRHRYPDQDDAGLRELCKTMGSLEQKRNLIIHSSWAHSGVANTMNRVKTTARGKLKHSFESVTLDELRALCVELDSVTQRLITFVMIPGHGNGSA